jgi:hypothetical protein
MAQAGPPQATHLFSFNPRHKATLNDGTRLNRRRNIMKKLVIAVALALAFTAPAMADGFNNAYYNACYQFHGCR